MFGTITTRNVHGGFSEKNLVLEILGKTGPKWPKNGHFGVLLKIGSKDFFIFCMKLEVNNGHILAKTACLGKIWFLSYGPKWYRPIRLLDSSNLDISRTA